MRFDVGHPDLQHVLQRVQDGVVARRQLLELGATPNDVRRMLRRRELFSAHPGVYIDHNGRPTREQLEWIAVLAAWPAALAFESALPRQRSDRVVQVVVAHDRTVQPPPHTTVQRMSGVADRIDWRDSPPRVRLEHAALDVMSHQIARGDVLAAFTTLSEVLFSRRTSTAALRSALAERSRLAGRRTIEGLLDDADTGACSVLERGYLQRVERAHGLPRGERQHASEATGRRTLQDVRYQRYGLIVELDGVLHAAPRARDADARRDLAELAVRGEATARVTYGLVFGGQCETARSIGSVLQRGGWTGAATRCPLCP